MMAASFPEAEEQLSGRPLGSACPSAPQRWDLLTCQSESPAGPALITQLCGTAQKQQMQTERTRLPRLPLCPFSSGNSLALGGTAPRVRKELRTALGLTPQV